MHRVIFGSVAAVIISACSGPDASDLDQVHQSIATRYSDVAHISFVDLKGAVRNEFVIFDVREKEEFQVSHVSGAIWVDPDMTAVEFLRKFGHVAKDKKAIFYCSVGERSSRMAQRVSSVAPDLSVYNLEKGIFGLHNAELPLTSAQGRTDFIHPYDDKWGELVERQDKVSYEPR